MPPRKTVTKTETETPVPKKEKVTVETETPAAPVKAVRRRKEATASTPEVETESKKTTRPREKPTNESVMVEFDELVALVELEMATLRDKNGSKGVKCLKTVNKRLKLLKNSAGRVMKTKAKGSDVKKNVNSGFSKPVRITPELAKFTGWDSAKAYARLDVTKFLCNYIKTHNLQNPSDRRQISPDAQLTRLLKYDTSQGPFTYYNMQKFMKCLFV